MPTGDPYCSICQSMIPCLHMYPGDTGRWEDEPKVEYGVETLRKEFRQRLYGNNKPDIEEVMDITPQDMIRITLDKVEHEERMKISRAQEMSQIAEAANRKSSATYRYSLVQYLREEIEIQASLGHFSLKIFSNKVPWNPAEIEQVLSFLKNDGFVVEFGYNQNTIGLLGSISNLDTTYKVLEISWK